MMLCPISDFKRLFEKYLNWGIKRATPAIYTEIRPIMKLNEEKVFIYKYQNKIIYDVVKNYYDVITTTKKIPGEETELSHDSILSSFIILANVL